MISVVVPSYNEEKNIVSCLESLNKQSIACKYYEIIVVDGQSRDKTLEIAKKYADKVIMQKSKGVGGARNDGAAVAMGDIIATTDADCCVSKEWLKEIKLQFDKNRDLIAIHGRDVPQSKRLKASSAFGTLDCIKFAGAKLGFHGMAGTNSAFKRKEFLDINGYRDIAYADDSEISIRLKRKGKIMYDRNMIVKVSTRRMEKYGYINTLGLCGIGYFQNRFNLPLFNKKIEKEVYE